MIKLKSRYTILFWLLSLVAIDLKAQPSGLASVHANDTVGNAGNITSHLLYGGAGYGSNMIYLGSTISQNLPFQFAFLAYGFKNDLYASVSAVHLNNLKPFGAFYIGSLSYNHTFNSWFDISADINRYQVVSSLTDTLFKSFVYGEIILGFDWRILYSRILAGGLFSDEKSSFFQIRNSRYFQTPEFFHEKANVSFDPYINLLFGTLISTETDAGTVYTFTQPGRKWKFKSLKQNSSANSEDYTKSFALLEMDFGLPVSFNSDLMTIEAEPFYVLPLHDTPDYPGPKGFLLTITAFFRIF